MERMVRRCWLPLMLAAGMGFTAGCESDDDRGTSRGRSHVPPAGSGAIVIENASGAEWNVQIDGVLRGRVATESFLVYDEEPGRHLIHLDEHHGGDVIDRAVGVEADILSVIRIDADSGGYDVVQFTVVP